MTLSMLAGQASKVAVHEILGRDGIESDAIAQSKRPDAQADPVCIDIGIDLNQRLTEGLPSSATRPPGLGLLHLHAGEDALFAHISS
jgi:hypothetical protein